MNEPRWANKLKIDTFEESLVKANEIEEIIINVIKNNSVTNVVLIKTWFS